jgi:hypothetical protein
MESSKTAEGINVFKPFKWMAHLLSYIFHPLFIPVYVTWFLTFVHPSFFAGYERQEKVWLLLRIVYTMVFLPIITVVILKGLKFIDSFFLKTQKDRIIPYIACGIYFFWVYLVFKNQTEVPAVLTAFCFAVFLSSSAALIANIYFKISMHAIGMGGALGLFVIIALGHSMLMTIPLMTVLILTGLVCSARLLISDHTNKEIYSGLLLGMISQFVAAAIIQPL